MHENRAKSNCPIKKLQIDLMLTSNNHSQKGKETELSLDFWLDHLLFYSLKFSPVEGNFVIRKGPLILDFLLDDTCWHIQK